MSIAKSALFGAVVAAGLALGGFATTASAAPLGGVSKSVPATASPVENVAYGRRCHWRNGYRVCRYGYSRRGYYGPGYGYYGPRYRGPGITLRFGYGDRGWRNRRWR